MFPTLGGTDRRLAKPKPAAFILGICPLVPDGRFPIKFCDLWNTCNETLLVVASQAATRRQVAWPELRIPCSTSRTGLPPTRLCLRFPTPPCNCVVTVIPASAFRRCL